MSAEDGKNLYLAMTMKGYHLAEKLRDALGGRAFCAHGTESFSLAEWTRNAFASGCDLIFVGAVGIAVRAVAPYLKSKAVDPAVVAVDECGRFAVPLVSGHLGGANDLARAVAAACGATPVITTATDVNGRFAVDEWARRQGCHVVQPGRIKTVSSRILAGETVAVRSRWPIAGQPPLGVELTEAENCQVRVDLHRSQGTALDIVPRAFVLGVGCRKGTSREALEEALALFCAERGLWPECICGMATIDLKAEETGLLDFCAAHSWPLSIYSAAELNRVPGTFTGSDFVKKTTGVDNVCERSAVLAAGGPLEEKKFARNGVTLALAGRPISLDWRWSYE